ncbi:hypothetical protein C8J56DRAFT_554595 [Mycena floridula]|nr:hypothetical protein C8J56DRAFT_554595 [Mycena floridula]
MHNNSLALAARRRRAVIACRNCRKRKIKCETQENPPQHPCERCTRKKLQCEYITVADDPDAFPPAVQPPQPQQSRGQAPMQQPLFSNTPPRSSAVSPGPSNGPYSLGPGYPPYPAMPSGFGNYPSSDAMMPNPHQSMSYPINPANNQPFQPYNPHSSNTYGWMNDSGPQMNRYVPPGQLPNPNPQWPPNQFNQQGSVPFQQSAHPRGCRCPLCNNGRV